MDKVEVWVSKMAITNTNNETVIEEFETGWAARKDSLRNFIEGCRPVVSSALQFELLRRELRLRLRSGSAPVLSDYAEDFPQFRRDIEAAIVSEATIIARGESPIERTFGELRQVVGGYEIVEQLHRDSVSVHYDAYQLSLSRNVRFRVLLFPSEENVAKACKVATLDHPNMETVIEVLRERSTCIIVSQIEHGESVADLVSRCSEMVTTQKAVRWIADAADSLLELHCHDVEHLNISPSNLIARSGGRGVLVEPNFDSALGSINGKRTAELAEQLPFPYRSLRTDSGDPRDRRKDDVVALGLVMFVLLTGASLESFYLSPPLPRETQRLKTLIQSHLEYSSGIDPVLKLLCQRTTLGIMNNEDPCYLPELKAALCDWGIPDESKWQDEKAQDKHSQSESFTNSVSKGFSWFSKQ